MRKFFKNILNYKNWTISFKVISIAALLIFVSVFLISFLSYIKYKNDFHVKSAENVQQIIEQVSLNINTYLDDLFRLSLSPYYNDDVIDALDNKINDSDLNFLNRMRTVETFLDQMMIIPRDDILRVFIITMDDEIYKSERITTTIDKTIDYKSYNWYKEVLEVQEPLFVPSHLEQIIKKPENIVFSVVNIIRSTRRLDRILGIIKVDANYDGIKSICNRVDMGKRGGLFIIDENQKILFSNIEGIPYKDFFLKAIESDDTYTTIKSEGEEFLLNNSKIDRSNWTLVAVSSLDEINEVIIQNRNIAFLMAFFSSVFSFILLIIFIRFYLKPFSKIINKIREIQKGKMSVKFPENSNNEIGYLGASLNKMIRNINKMIRKNTKLVTEIYEAKYLQKEAQVKVLYNQIRPHFIYNTLNQISLLIQSGREDEAVDDINKLSNILRGMANLDKETTVKDEIDLLESYLGIQKSRYGDRIEYCFNIDKTLNSFKIPPLLIQPIIENAIIHGCETKKEKTVIKVRGFRENNTIVFIIEDTGAGMDSKSLKKIKDILNNYKIDINNLDVNFNNKGSGIGIINVNRRIKIKYGEEFGLSVESNLGEGTKVKIILPENI